MSISSSSQSNSGLWKFSLSQHIFDQNVLGCLVLKGEDFANLFPVVQWLVRRVIETRAQTGNIIRAFSEFEFGKIFRLPEENFEVCCIFQLIKKKVFHPFHPFPSFHFYFSPSCTLEKLSFFRCHIFTISSTASIQEISCALAFHCE